jgi:Ca2+-binding RTX toxin-like protein
MIGGGGRDVARGGRGVDDGVGGPGDDRLFGGPAGDSTLFGGAGGADRVDGGGGNDACLATFDGSGNDVVVAVSGRITTSCGRRGPERRGGGQLLR